MSGDEFLSADDSRLMAAARSALEFQCDVFFRIVDSIYVGPEEGIDTEAWRDRRVALPAPDLPLRLPGLIASADLTGREQALVDHYARIIRIAEDHGKTDALDRPFPYFQVRPAIIAGGDIVVGWPWSDSAAEASAIMELLATTNRIAPGTVLLDDQDQGWALRIVGAGDTVCVVEWDAEGPPPGDAAIRLDAAALARQAAAALSRLRAVHGALIRQLGRDVWS